MTNPGRDCLACPGSATVIVTSGHSGQNVSLAAACPVITASGPAQSAAARSRTIGLPRSSGVQ